MSAQSRADLRRAPGFALIPLLLIWALLWVFVERTAPADEIQTTSATEERAGLVLGQDEQRLLKAPGFSRFSVGGGAFRATSLPGPPGAPSHGLLLKGVHPGAGDLWVFYRSGAAEHRVIQVERLPEGDLPPKLIRALSGLQETEVITTPSGVLLRGELQSLAEAARVSALSTGSPAPGGPAVISVTNETEPSAALLALGLKRLEQWVARAHLGAQLRIEQFGQALWVRGSIDSPSRRLEAERGARAAFPPVKTEIDSMPDSAPTVHFRVFLLELKKSRFGSFGLSWPAAQDGAFHVSPSAIRQNLSLDVAIQAMEGDGSARILSNPELVVRAPGEAELFAGGELPIPRRTRYQEEIVWKNYGLTLSLKVSATTATRVRLDILTEVSHLDSNIGVDQIPGIQANRMKTQVDARYGVPLLLSGLLQRNAREQARGLPWLRDLPVLGPLFGSKDYLNETSELVAILLPSSAPPPPPEPVTGAEGPEYENVDLRFSSRWRSPSDGPALRDSPEYPWNAVEKVEKAEKSEKPEQLREPHR